ncbi:hypothetical protein GGTG_13969 [Gaeumannomyces tritici R3-111a-1]|uniref:Uncharacterized protein n=1 Tax=Gaeumannomyces tritici (strain R3-111a-1) TaxID=644352 RepID=J3PKB8_GAET3|nr:hypothetical protein GGTG_13969 [Gaeumannomyces tritici R3-111a-1]EJT68451.1 hypothetical protein GGTG_13969 [Gaeumannomyces tritici R3-111a-1]
MQGSRGATYPVSARARSVMRKTQLCARCSKPGTIQRPCPPRWAVWPAKTAVWVALGFLRSRYVAAARGYQGACSLLVVKAPARRHRRQGEVNHGNNKGKAHETLPPCSTSTRQFARLPTAANRERRPQRAARLEHAAAAIVWEQGQRRRRRPVDHGPQLLRRLARRHDAAAADLATTTAAPSSPAARPAVERLPTICRRRRRRRRRGE